jgi:hypothetical protein
MLGSLMLHEDSAESGTSRLALRRTFHLRHGAYLKLVETTQADCQSILATYTRQQCPCMQIMRANLLNASSWILARSYAIRGVETPINGYEEGQALDPWNPSRWEVSGVTGQRSRSMRDHALTDRLSRLFTCREGI